MAALSAGVSKHWTGFSTGTMGLDIELDHGTGVWDWNSTLALEPTLAGTGVSKHWTGFSPGMWDWIIELECGVESGLE